MIPVGPISLTLSTPVTEVDPAQTHGSTSASVQIQNSSAFVLIVLSAGDPYTIQPFFATTIPVSGAPIVITPTQNPQNTSGNTITIVWLLNGEQPPQEDGPLNLPLSTVEQLINAGLNTKLTSTGFAASQVLAAAVPGKQIIIGAAFIQPGILSGGTLTAVILNATVGGITTPILAAYSGPDPQPASSLTYPQGLACDVNTGVTILVTSAPLTNTAYAGISYALAA